MQISLGSHYLRTGQILAESLTRGPVSVPGRVSVLGGTREATSQEHSHFARLPG